MPIIYLERFVGELVEIAETGDITYLEKDFPDEYAGLWPEQY